MKLSLLFMIKVWSRFFYLYLKLTNMDIHACLNCFCLCADNFLNCNLHRELSVWSGVPVPTSGQQLEKVSSTSVEFPTAGLLSPLLPLTRLFYNRKCFLLPVCFLLSSHAVVTSIVFQYPVHEPSRSKTGGHLWSYWPQMFLHKCLTCQDAALTPGEASCRP